jgi:hypothetical protein
MSLSLPKEYSIPRLAEFVWVEDFFVEEILGGAELTSDAIIRGCNPQRIKHLHSQSLTETLVKTNQHKTWIFGNQTQVPFYLLHMFMTYNIRYYFFEYDYKPCIYRSIKKHEMESGKPCDCHLKEYGMFMAQWMAGAQKIFWCSTGQKDQFYRIYPELLEGRDPSRDVIQWSTFYPESIMKMRELREARQRGEIEVLDRWIVLDSASWIKGTEDSVRYCRENNMNFQLVKGVSNDEFLRLLSSSKGMVFLPLDIDVGSRTKIESLLVGTESITNNNVLPSFEPLILAGKIDDIESWLLDGPMRFWRNVEG